MTTEPMPIAEVSAEDREAFQQLSGWLYESTDGKVKMVAKNDRFFGIQIFARHRIQSVKAAIENKDGL